MNILHRYEDGDRRIVVAERADGSRIYLENDIPYTDIDAEGNSLLPYCTAMEKGLRDATEVLLLGTAGGVLATQLSRQGVKVTAVDNVAVAFDMAKQWFHLPEDVECIHADAVEFLRANTRQWDGIAVDVFFQGVEIPESMLTEEIGVLLAKALKPGGSLVWNVADSANSWRTHWVVKTLRLGKFSPRPVSVVHNNAGNTVVVCRPPAA